MNIFHNRLLNEEVFAVGLYGGSHALCFSILCGTDLYTGHPVYIFGTYTSYPSDSHG